MDVLYIADCKLSNMVMSNCIGIKSCHPSAICELLPMENITNCSLMRFYLCYNVANVGNSQ